MKRYSCSPHRWATGTALRMIYMYYSVSDTGQAYSKNSNPSAPNRSRTCDLPITTNSVAILVFHQIVNVKTSEHSYHE